MPESRSDFSDSRRAVSITLIRCFPQLRRGPVLRKFQPDPAGLDARWCGDIAYIATDEGWLYLATVIDIASRRVVGWATADHLRTDLVADTLMAACRKRRPIGPVIFHSDRGCQGGFNWSSQHPDLGGVRRGYGGLEFEDQRCPGGAASAVAR
ncbi:transposase InsO family protein [Streptomyces achromogenes]|uniref:transposase n=1 Tax=Streptomyces achromogenes TaxID=67255 RepID=UPI002787CDAD|nr:transposase InsO family protein [Streptomyces achromogenes]